MTRASFTAPGANRSTLFCDGKGTKNPRMKQENRRKNDENTADL